MSAALKQRRKPTSGSSDDTVSAEVEAAAWERRMGLQRERRQGTDAIWRSLDDLLVHEARPKGRVTNGHHRAQALQSGRTREELLQVAVTETRRMIAPGALEQGYTTQAGAGLIAIALKSGQITHQSPSFQDLSSWIPAEARGNIKVSLEARDGDEFHSFCQSVAKDAGELYGETFLDRAKVVGRSITVRFFNRAPGPPGLRNPEWLLMMRSVKLTLVGVQPRQLGGESPAAGTNLPFSGQGRVPEAIGVFTADLSGGTPAQWTVQAAHVRNLLDMEVAPGTYAMDVGNHNPFTALTTFDVQVSKLDGAGASLLSYAKGQLEYAASSARSIAQRSASWLTSKAMNITQKWAISLDERDDTVSIQAMVLFVVFGGLSTSISHEHVGGKVAFSDGGLDVMHFIADPEQPLDCTLRAMLLQIASTKTGGDFDVHHPLVMSIEWEGGVFRNWCKKIDLYGVGTKMNSVEDEVSDLFAKLEVSNVEASSNIENPSESSSNFCIRHLGVQRASPDTW